MSDLFKRAKALFRPPEPERVKATTARKPAAAWHAVSIAPGERACAAAREMEGRRFLSRQAPTLPLKACDQARCKCRYAHHEDRRRGPRRAHELSVSIDGYESNERRATTGRKGRRRTDP